jgi:hypothetical protein
VVHAGQRNIAEVRNIYQACVCIAGAMLQLNGKFAKKTEMVNGTLRKLENIVYELTFLQCGGRRVMVGEAPVPGEIDSSTFAEGDGDDL